MTDSRVGTDTVVIAVNAPMLNGTVTVTYRRFDQGWMFETLEPDLTFTPKEREGKAK